MSMLTYFPACYYNGRNYEDGSQFDLDACTRCSCRHGDVQCSKTACPDVRCPNPITRPGECCPTCTSGNCDLSCCWESFYDKSVKGCKLSVKVISRKFLLKEEICSWYLGMIFAGIYFENLFIIPKISLIRAWKFLRLECGVFAVD